MADEKELQRSHQDIDKLFNSLKNLEVEGMDEILIELKNSELWNLLLELCSEISLIIDSFSATEVNVL